MVCVCVCENETGTGDGNTRKGRYGRGGGSTEWYTIEYDDGIVDRFLEKKVNCNPLPPYIYDSILHMSGANVSATQDSCEFFPRNRVQHRVW